MHLRTGPHWGAEETGRWARHPRVQRVCPHCHNHNDTMKMPPHLLTCPLFASLRLNFRDLFAESYPPHRFPPKETDRCELASCLLFYCFNPSFQIAMPEEQSLCCKLVLAETRMEAHTSRPHVLNQPAPARGHPSLQVCFASHGVVW